MREVVKQLSLQQGVKTWDLVKDPKLSACPASSVKDEVTRAVIGHCELKIRSILDSIEERAKYQYKSDSAPSPVPPASTSGGGGVAAAPIAAGGSSGQPADDDAADLECLVYMLARAKVVPATKRHDFVRKLLDQGVCDERAIWCSLCANPPEFDLVSDIGMTGSQKRYLDSYLKDFKL